MGIRKWFNGDNRAMKKPLVYLFILSALHSIAYGQYASDTVTAVQSSGSNLHVNVDSMPSTPVTGTVTANQGGIWSTGRTWSLLNTTDSVNVGNFPVTQPVSGSISVSNFPATIAVTQSTSPWVTSRTWNLISGSDSIDSVQSGTWNVGLSTGSNTIGKIDQGAGGVSAWKVDGSAVTQPVSAASLPLPSGAATSALQTSGNASLTSIDSKLTSPLTVTGPLTDAQLRASAVPTDTAKIAGAAISTGNGVAGAGVQRITIASDNTPFSVQNISPQSSSADLTSVTNSNASFSIVASNSSRKGLYIVNDSNTQCYYAFAASATTSAYSFRLTANSIYTMDVPIYTGAVSAICNANNGASKVTEI